MKSGSALLIPATVLGLIAGVVGAIAVVEMREPMPAPVASANTDDRAIADLAAAVDRLTIALDEADAEGDPQRARGVSPDTAALMQRLDVLIDRLGRERAARPVDAGGAGPGGSGPVASVDADGMPGAQPADAQTLALVEALARLQSNRKGYDNLYAQQLAILLDDPNSGEHELLYALERCVWDDMTGEVYDVLSRAMRHENGAVRAASMFTMLDWNDDCIVPFQRITEQLADPDPRVRQVALMLAGSARSPEAYDTVLSWQRGADDDWAYVMALGRLQDSDHLTDEQYEFLEDEISRFDDLDADERYYEFEEELFSDR